MKVHDGSQRTDDWFAVRAGKITASEFGNLVTPKWEIRKPDSGMFQSYLNRKLAEKWTGQPQDTGYIGYAAETGSMLEDEAFAWTAFELGLDIQRPMFVETDDGRCGCSPDGIAGEAGLELKCPQATNQVRNLRANGLHEDYVHQIHFSMFVTGFSRWQFVSYSRRLPKVVLTIQRDERIQAIIAKAVAGFVAEFDAGYAVLVGKNGGEPQRAGALTDAEPAMEEQERFDINN